MKLRTTTLATVLTAIAGTSLALCPPETKSGSQEPVACCIKAPVQQAQNNAIPSDEPAAAKAAESRIDVVFVLDTTGSMSGLIEGAKAKIWSVANQIASAKPKPTLRIGLVAYRDVGDEYVTRVTPMSDDLDAVYADLMKFAAGGGGDTPESVNQGLNEAVTKFDWQPTADQYLKLIYLVGDCPPHMDYAQDVKYPESCKMAAEKGITINTIQCGGHSETTPIWQEIARKAEGEFFQIDQSGGMQAVATPYDAELARLGTELDGTLVAYGNAEAQTAMAYKIAQSAAIDAAGAPPEAMAERAACKAEGGATLWGRQELVQACAEGKVRLADLKEEELPEQMRVMTVAQRETFVKEKAEARARCQAQIAELNEKRQAFIKDQLAQAGPGDSFDAKVLACLRTQAGRRGIVYAEK